MTLASPQEDRRFFGHPRGLATLFFTEMWERFSYYGLRALLLLFMTAEGVKGGLGFSTERAGAIYGLCTGAAWLAALPGGWIADRLIGQRRAVFAGGCLIAAGNFCLAFESLVTFYLGLVLIVLGTGLLKPNVSAMVGQLYPAGDARRDSGFSIFYMGINVGAIGAPLVCGTLGQKVNWHLGFASAGVFMIAGLVQYVLGGRLLGEAGKRSAAASDPAGRRRPLAVLAAASAAIALFGALQAGGVLGLSAETLANGAVFAIVAIALAYFLFQVFAGGLDAGEKRRMYLIFVLFIFSALFWSGFEQAGSSLNLFAEKLTNLRIGAWEMAASQLQSINPLFLVIFAPVFAWIWIALGRRNPSSPTKFAFGLIFMGLGFLVMVFAARASAGTATLGPQVVAHRVSPMWLIVTYFFHTCGELCLSPVGLSTVTKLAPHRKVGQMMGIWFMSISLGNLIGGLVASRFEAFPLYLIFGTVAAFGFGAGLILWLLSGPIHRLAGGAD